MDKTTLKDQKISRENVKRYNLLKLTTQINRTWPHWIFDYFGIPARLRNTTKPSPPGLRSKCINSAGFQLFTAHALPA